jgi:hypothetical protein
MPLELACTLCRAGVRCCFDQLVAAARSSTAGVEVWRIAQQHEEVLHDLPPAAGPLLCGYAEGAFSKVSEWPKSGMLQIRVC